MIMMSAVIFFKEDLSNSFPRTSLHHCPSVPQLNLQCRSLQCNHQGYLSNNFLIVSFFQTALYVSALKSLPSLLHRPVLPTFADKPRPRIP